MNEKPRYETLVQEIRNCVRYPVSKTPLDEYIAYYLVHVPQADVAGLIAHLMSEVLVHEILAKRARDVVEGEIIDE